MGDPLGSLREPLHETAVHAYKRGSRPVHPFEPYDRGSRRVELGLSVLELVSPTVSACDHAPGRLEPAGPQLAHRAANTGFDGGEEPAHALPTGVAETAW